MVCSTLVLANSVWIFSFFKEPLKTAQSLFWVYSLGLQPTVWVYNMRSERYFR